MGGDAYLISGTVDSRHWPLDQQPTSLPPPRSLWQRLTSMVGSTDTSGLPRITTLPNGERLIELPSGPLNHQLVSDCIRWLTSRLAPPSQASTLALKYLREIKPTLYLRGQQRRDEMVPEFYIQITFSGCAGQAETSARLASHWTALWYRTEHTRLTSEYLTPFGFQPRPLESLQEEPMYFLPVSDVGYVEYLPPADPSAEPLLELDYCIVESRPNDRVIEKLNGPVALAMADRRCHCQLCDPGFNAIRT